MHALRVNYQAAIWKCCLESEPFVPSPNLYGWMTNDSGNPAIEWMLVHQSQMQYYNYSLTSEYDRANCQSAHDFANGLRYTDMCNLQTCNNQPAEDNEAYCRGT